MKSKHVSAIQKYGVKLALEAAQYAKDGEGCSTVGFYLNLHWKTASLLMDAGSFLPMVFFKATR